jgi:anti-sigma regulatory factor (Ser/Thr protein kinase)
MPLQLANTAMMNIYQATRNPAPATTICLLQQLAFPLVIALLLVDPLGPDGVWLAFLLGEGCTLCFLGAVVLLRRGGRLRFFADVLLLKDDFGGNPLDRFEKTIGTTMDEAVGVSAELYAFGAQRGLSPAMMHRVALCVEEIAGNVARHAARHGKPATMDLLVLNKPHDVVICIRDNQRMFDPVAYLKENASVDKHFGIRLAQGVTDGFEYHRTIGLNNVRMVIHK